MKNSQAQNEILHFEKPSLLPSSKHLLPSSHPLKSLLVTNRTKRETLSVFLTTDTFYHLLYMIALYVATSAVWYTADATWIIDSMLDEHPDARYAIYTAACIVLHFEVLSFIVISTIRTLHGIKHAEVHDNRRLVRAEETNSVRHAAFMVLYANVILSLAFIFMSLLQCWVDEHHRVTAPTPAIVTSTVWVRPTSVVYA